MKKSLSLFSLFSLFSLVIMCFAASAHADATTVKIATLAPPDSPWGQVFKVWQRAVTARSSGALELQFYWSGQQGDDRAMVGKMRTGQLDGATLAGAGLGEIDRQVLVLQLPGLFREWAKLDAARSDMQAGFDARFEQQGFKVLGWGDVGRAHTMSRGFQVHVPADLKHHRAFYLPGDPIAPTVFALIGDITPRQTSVPEILPGLTAGTIDVMSVPALVAEQLQWSSRLDTIGEDVAGIGIGAVVVSSASYRAIPADAQAVLTDTGRVAGDALTRRVRAEDDAAYARLLARMTHYGLSEAERAEWERLFVETARRLRGSVFDPSIMDEAVRHR
jgi:TRAP-type C4-dicarboxylate transport system substrate-binding protein